MERNLRYDDALGWLSGLKSAGIRLGLSRVREALARLGDPHAGLKAITIAGTNGKGSTAAFCESILRSSGYRVGLYTSPHLIHFCERIQVNRMPLQENEIIDLIENSLENIAISEDYNEKQNNTETSGEVDIETKLEKFKSMLDKGLITEEEYQAKKEELLAL